jgi:hypothetical protein
LTAAEKELFIENIALKVENGFLKKQNQALRERIHTLEQIPEFEHIKKAAHGAGTPKSSKEKYRITIISQSF